MNKRRYIILDDMRGFYAGADFYASSANEALPYQDWDTALFVAERLREEFPEHPHYILETERAGQSLIVLGRESVPPRRGL